MTYSQLGKARGRPPAPRAAPPPSLSRATASNSRRSCPRLGAHSLTWSTLSFGRCGAVINLTPRAGELRSAPRGPRGRMIGIRLRAREP